MKKLPYANGIDERGKDRDESMDGRSALEPENILKDRVSKNRRSTMTSLKGNCLAPELNESSHRSPYIERWS